MSLAAAFVAGSALMLGSATASAQDHTDAALDFIARATPNEWGDGCSINWEVEGGFASGTTKSACFFNLSLKRAEGYADRDLRAMWGFPSPTSAVLFDFVDTSPPVGSLAPAVETYFRKITQATGPSGIQKGDILVMDATSAYAGHTVIVTGPPSLIEPAIMPVYSGTKQYAVPIADSTEDSHGCNASYPDSRWGGTCTGGYMDPGADTGFLRVYTDSLSGVLLGFTWSVTSSLASYYSPTARPYRVGRLFNLPAPISGP